MKLLNRIKLIHWHYFQNETIPLKGSALLTGENGSGKSTILDAIQLALVADVRKVRFNISAHEETRRDLRGYLRCKTGSDTADGLGQGFLRNEDFTTYVVLEFYDTRKKAPFLVGTVIDSYASGDHDPPRFFKIEDQGVDDELFLSGSRPRNVREFKSHLARLKDARFYHTAEQYRTDLLVKLGHLGERFFTLLVKALAFKPITNIRQFVYDYVLDERSINIDAMRENLQQYRHFEALLQQTKEKIARLEEIGSKFLEKRKVEDWIRVQDYLILRAELEDGREAVEHLRAEQNQARKGIERTEAEIASIRAKRSSQQALRDDLIAARGNNSAWQLAQSLDQDIKHLKDNLSRLEDDRRKLVQTGRTEASDVALLVRLAGDNTDHLGLGPQDLSGIRRALPLLDRWAGGNLNGDAPDEDLSRLAADLLALGSRLLERNYSFQQSIQTLEGEAGKLRQDLESLRSHRLVYDESVETLRRVIREEVAVGGKAVQPHVLCELLEIPNEKWQNAIEGYLNTQRFDLIVPPEAFDRALSVYERRKGERKISNVGLINTGRVLAHLNDTVPGSLAEEIQTSDQYARSYVNRLLGRVMKCETEQELKRHNVAITPTCMTYRNHTARQIPFHVYETPYIGKRAIARQVELKEARLREIEGELRTLRQRLELGRQCQELCRDRRDRYQRAAELWKEVAQIPATATQLREKEKQRASIDLTEILKIDKEIEIATSAIKAFEDREAQLIGNLGGLREKLKMLEGQILALEAGNTEKLSLLEQFARENPAAAEQGAARYQDERRSRNNQEIIRGFRQNRTTLASRVQNLQGNLVELRSEYNSKYHFGGAPGAADNSAYDQEYRKLTESELPQYEERITGAKKAAEEEFKEHFVYKLKELIETARDEFDNLNEVLRDITFGQDRYKFLVTPSGTYRRFYDMITDEDLMEGHSLFSLHFQEKHRATIDELFSLILDVPEEEQMKNIERFTDYRTYLDYDIKITHSNGETSTFSKVCREKSGGETQTPYYVAIVASFLQLYRHKYNEDSVRLMMFDEAFNRMDVDRVENTLIFINQLGLQVLAAAPTDKCEIIAPHVDTTLLVIRDGHRTWIEDYHQVREGALQAEVAATGATATIEAESEISAVQERLSS